MHPINIDGCLQSGAPSLWLGHRSTVNAVLVPAIIDNVVIYSPPTRPTKGIAISSRDFVGVGRLEEAKSYKSEIQVHDPSDGSPLFSLSGLHYHKLETHARLHTTRDYTHVTWRPDITWASRDMLLTLFPEPSANHQLGKYTLPAFHQVLDIIAHKKPTLRIVEANIDAVGSESVWLGNMHGDRGIRAAYRQLLYTFQDADNLLDARARYPNQRFTEFLLLELTKDPKDFLPTETGFDLVIIKEVRSFSVHCRRHLPGLTYRYPVCQ